MMKRFRTKADIKENLNAGRSIVTIKDGIRTVYRCSDIDPCDIEKTASQIYKDRKYIDYDNIAQEIALKRIFEANIGTIKRREQDAIARKALPKIKTFFRRQRTLFFKRFDTYKNYFPEAERRTALYTKLIEQDRQFTLNDFNSTWQSVEVETTDELQALIYSIETDAMMQGGEIAKTFFKPDAPGTFELDNPRAVNWFSQYGGSIDYISGIQNTSKNQIKTIIEKALDEGWSYNQTSKVTSDRFTAFTRERAQLIATHESAQAYEAGNRIFIDGLADEGIVMQKKWMTSRDEKVTPECRANMEDGWIPLTQAHLSGDQNPPRFPGCRCFEIFQEVKK